MSNYVNLFSELVKELEGMTGYLEVRSTFQRVNREYTLISPNLSLNQANEAEANIINFLEKANEKGILSSILVEELKNKLGKDRGEEVAALNLGQGHAPQELFHTYCTQIRGEELNVDQHIPIYANLSEVALARDLCEAFLKYTNDENIISFVISKAIQITFRDGTASQTNINEGESYIRRKMNETSSTSSLAEIAIQLFRENI